MRLDDAAGAVVEGGSGAELLAEEETGLSLVVGCGSGAVDCVSHGVRSENGSESTRGNLFGFLGVGWTKDVSESRDGIFCD
jgi:hypothetical protein